MGTWAGPTHGCGEYVRDATSPLWSRRLLGPQLALPASERAADRFHRAILEQLAPAMIDVPFADATGWPTPRSRVGRRSERVLTLARKGRRRIETRFGAMRARSAPAAAAPAAAVAGPAAPPGPTLAQTLMAEVRRQTAEQPGHPAWEVLDRPRVARLLGSDPDRLDEMSVSHLRRLAGVFCAGLESPPW
jgi:hypothetical protein